MKKIAFTLLGFGIVFAIAAFCEKFAGMPDEALKIPEFLAIGCIGVSGMLFAFNTDAA